MVMLDLYPDITSYKQIVLILEQMRKCIIKIYREHGYSTGFFCFIIYKSHKIPMMIISNHLIDEIFLKNNDFIYLESNDEKKN